MINIKTHIISEAFEQLSKSEKLNESVKSELLKLFKSKGFDLTREDVHNYIDSAAEYIEMAQDADGSYSVEEWYKDTMTNYPEDLLELRSETEIDESLTEEQKPLRKMNTNELRDIAVSLGADRKKLYGTSKQALMLTIDQLKRKNKDNSEGNISMNKIAEDYNEVNECKLGTNEYEANPKRKQHIEMYRKFANLNESEEITEDNINDWALQKTATYCNRHPNRIKAEILGKRYSEYERD